jgi:hypothetical protein
MSAKMPCQKYACLIQFSAASMSTKMPYRKYDLSHPVSLDAAKGVMHRLELSPTQFRSLLISEDRLITAQNSDQS